MSQVPAEHTGLARRDWIRTRYAALVGAFERIIAPFDDALELAIVVLALWAIETGWGRNELCFNAGNKRRGSWPGDWYVYAGREWRAYASIDDAAEDMARTLLSVRYGPATAAFLRTRDSAQWYRLMLDHPTLGPGWHPTNESSETEFLNAIARIPTYAR